MCEYVILYLMGFVADDGEVCGSEEVIGGKGRLWNELRERSHIWGPFRGSTHGQGVHNKV